jgi:hypothetical protein
MIVAASTTLLSDSRSGSRGGVLPWALLVVGSVASLAANVAVAEPTVTGRVIAAWPSFALIAAYELLMRQVRHGAARGVAFTSGKEIGRQYGRHERWGRLVKRAGTAGEFNVGNAPDDRCGDKEEVLAAAAT